jgi:hypothetical protein
LVRAAVANALRKAVHKPFNLAINLAAAALKAGNVAARCPSKARTLALIGPHVLGDQVRRP